MNLPAMDTRTVFQAADHAFMARAIRLAERGLYTTQPNPRVGCVIVAGQQVVGEGYHLQAGGPHAEVFALRQAGDKARGATAYITLEPCSHQGKTPPCADALIEAGVSRVICAMQDPNPLVSGKGLARLEQAGIETHSGLMQAEAEALNPGFIKRMRQGLPYVRVKLAMSLDGRTAMASGESQWITSAEARLDVQKWRARSSVILIGSDTVIADNPSMNVRLEAQQLNLDISPHQPLRAIIDSRLRVGARSRIFSQPGEVVIFTTADKIAQASIKGVEKIPVALSTNDKLDLREVLQWLASQAQANEVHVEAGAQLCGALLQARLVDEIMVYMAPHIMGDSARGLFHLPGMEKMSQRIALHIDDIRALGGDWRIRARPVYNTEADA